MYKNNAQINVNYDGKNNFMKKNNTNNVFDSKSKNNMPYIPPQAVGYVNQTSSTGAPSQSRKMAESASRKLSGKKGFFEFTGYDNPARRASEMQNDPWRRSQLRVSQENAEIESGLPYRIFNAFQQSIKPIPLRAIVDGTFYPTNIDYNGREMYQLFGQPVTPEYTDMSKRMKKSSTKMRKSIKPRTPRKNKYF